MRTTGSGPRGGRPSKGRRHPAKVSIPIEQYEQYLQLAAEAGMCMSDYLANACAAAHGLPLPYPPDLRQTETLPISA
jgi:hypothetical protein